MPKIFVLFLLGTLSIISSQGLAFSHEDQADASADPLPSFIKRVSDFEFPAGYEQWMQEVKEGLVNGHKMQSEMGYDANTDKVDNLLAILKVDGQNIFSSFTTLNRYNGVTMIDLNSPLKCNFPNRDFFVFNE